MLRRHTANILHGLGPLYAVVDEINFPAADPRQLAGIPEQFLTFAQPLFGLLAMGDVAGDAKDTDDATFRVVHRRLDRFENPRIAVRGESELFFVDAWFPDFQSLAVVVTKGIGGFRLLEIVIGFAGDLCLRRTKEAFKSRIATQISALEVLEPDEVGNGFDQGTILRFGKTQGIFGQLWLGDIPDNADDAFLPIELFVDGGDGMFRTDDGVIFLAHPKFT